MKKATALVSSPGHGGPTMPASKTKALRALLDTTEVPEARSRQMATVRSKETKPEVRFRKALWAAGLRGYRKNVKQLPGKPDVVYGPAKVAIFVHGCFWHRCPRCARNEPKTNSRFWTAKLNQNVERDLRKEKELRERGFKVITVWECDLRSNLDVILDEVRAALKKKT